MIDFTLAELLTSLDLSDDNSPMAFPPKFVLRGFRTGDYFRSNDDCLQFSPHLFQAAAFDSHEEAQRAVWQIVSEYPSVLLDVVPIDAGPSVCAAYLRNVDAAFGRKVTSQSDESSVAKDEAEADKAKR